MPAAAPLTPPEDPDGVPLEALDPDRQVQEIQAAVLPPPTPVIDPEPSTPPGPATVASDALVESQREVERLRRENVELRTMLDHFNRDQAANVEEPLDEPRIVTPTMPGAPSQAVDAPIQVLGPPPRTAGWNDPL